MFYEEYVLSALKDRKDKQGRYEYLHNKSYLYELTEQEQNELNLLEAELWIYHKKLIKI